jgi:hypothetical protein
MTNRDLEESLPSVEESMESRKAVKEMPMSLLFCADEPVVPMGKRNDSERRWPSRHFSALLIIGS